ncbi:MAG: c-type cytochrome [Magnetococcales bacterium]|nr:c-type cytochrome [Magnetococcales bacterium]
MPDLFPNRLLRNLLLSAGALWLAEPALAGTAAEVARGKLLAEACRACHHLDGKTRQGLAGPSLVGVWQRQAGTVPHYSYSEGMRAKSRACLIWNGETLEAFLTSPSKVVPGTHMSFNASLGPAERPQVIAYLSTLGKPPAVSRLALRLRESAEGHPTRAIDPERVSAGQEEARKCTACHDLTSQRKILIGPPLWGVWGRAVASSPGFCYSEAMRRLPSDLVWNERSLSLFLEDPPGMVAGTRMLFTGVKAEKRRLGLIGFLRTLQ